MAADGARERPNQARVVPLRLVSQPRPSSRSLAALLSELTAAGELAEELPKSRLRCVACGHRCLIPPGAVGVCKVRFNQDGMLRVPFGYVGALQVDPVEKKPFFHFLPGSTALSFGMLGCDFHCGYCQNWVTSQALRDPQAQSSAMPVSAGQLARLARERGSQLVVSTYNEPLITSEWAVAVFREARALGLRTAYVSNGNATPEVLDYIRPYVDAYKVDLKAMRDRSYRKLGGLLEHVRWTIRAVHERGFWLEVVTLIVPGFNDSDEELRDAAEFLAGVSPEIPWHVTAFHPDYKMLGPERTPVDTLRRAQRIGRDAGLQYVYSGNLPGQVGETEHTRCPRCASTVIQRYGFQVIERRLKADGACPDCGAVLPGIWS